MSETVKRILLVEPETVLAEITAFRLELLGYSVEMVASAEDALQKITDPPPDLVITDLVLPGLQGLALIERLSSDELTSDVPVMVLSIDADLDQVQTAYSAGAVDFLVVPFHPEVLEEKVAGHLAKTPKKHTSAKETEKEVVAG